MKSGISPKDFIRAGRRLFEEIRILIQISQSKLGQAALADAEEISGAAGPEILFGDGEAVRVLFKN